MLVVNPGSISEPIFEAVIIKDPHCNWGFANRIRYSHEEDLDFKWGFLSEYMSSNNIKNIIATGDLVDTNDERKWSFKQYYINKEKLLKFKGQNTIWSPAGNHDMLNGFEGVAETPFGEFVREDVIKYLSKEPININNCFIYGLDFSKHKEVTQKRLEFINNNVQPGTITLVVFHAHVTPAEIGCTEWTYDELMQSFPNIDGYICGHYHGGFPTQIFYKPGSTTEHIVFINPWSFQRVVRDYYNEMNIHIPEFVHIKIGYQDNWLLEFNHIQVPVKNYDETFKPKIVELLKVTRKEHFQFFETVNFDDVKVGADDSEIIEQFAQEDGITKEVVIKALEYLNNVQIED